jgi:DNA modification methylase
MILQGDCLQVLKGMDDKSVDFCFTDPPYNVGKDYGENKDNLSDAEYLNWIQEVLLQIKRVAVVACIYVPQKYMLQYWDILGAGYKQIILSYSPSGAIRWGYSNQFSSLLTDAKPNTTIQNVWHNTQMPGLGYFFRENNYGHPGYTSHDITGRVIENFTTEGQTVIDPFMGTGTTGVECAKRGRKFIGIEQETKWFELATRRISEAERQVRLL